MNMTFEVFNIGFLLVTSHSTKIDKKQNKTKTKQKTISPKRVNKNIDLLISVIVERINN